ncbi:MAG: hypothetical protein DI538_19070 [Azospira oryzae]|jgi:hypothetical protein|nr:MAG: hypothetical protein DI538_19070 [Azospira oryzae]
MPSKVFSLPAQSLLNNNSAYDYIDSFTADLNDPQNEITSQDVGKAFLTSAPGWVEKLFSFRNKAVALFGAKIPNGNRQE